jgi:pantoate kinase
VLYQVFSGDKLVRIMENAALSKDNLTLQELFQTMKANAFTELSNASNIDVYRRNLQKAYVAHLSKLLKPKDPVYVMSVPPGAGYGMSFRMVDLSLTDVPSVVRAQLEQIRKECRTKVASTADVDTKNHLNDLIVRISEVLDVK